MFDHDSKGNVITPEQLLPIAIVTYSKKDRTDTPPLPALEHLILSPGINSEATCLVIDEGLTGSSSDDVGNTSNDVLNNSLENTLSACPSLDRPTPSADAGQLQPHEAAPLVINKAVSVMTRSQDQGTAFGLFYMQ